MSADYRSDLAACPPHSVCGMRGHMLTGVATGYGTGRSRGRGDIVKYQSTGIVEQLRDVNAKLLKTGACEKKERKIVIPCTSTSY